MITNVILIGALLLIFLFYAVRCIRQKKQLNALLGKIGDVSIFSEAERRKKQKRPLFFRNVPYFPLLS
jgi:hypothetical protein